MERKLNWKQIYKKCKDRDICSCGQTELCNHPEQEDDDFCEKEHCPKLKKRK